MKQSQNNELDNRVLITKLFDLYQEFLTDKQKQYFCLYYFDDMSLAEISNQFKISRIAILDSIKKTTNILYDFETKLQLLSLKEQVCKILDTNQDVKQIKHKIRSLNFFKE